MALNWLRGVRLSAITVGVGLAGLLVGLLLFPHSNLLGGLALIFGPVYWIGLLALVVCTVGVICTTLARLRRKNP